MDMNDSSTYRLILSRGAQKGELCAAKRILLLQGRIRFGPPDAATTNTFEKITDLGYLEHLCERLLVVATWQELLATPTD